DFGLKDRCPGMLKRYARGRMAADARAVPHLNKPRRIGSLEKDFVPRGPALVLEKVRKWEAELLVSKLSRYPLGLHMMGASQHVDPFPDFRTVFRFYRRHPGFPGFKSLLFESHDELPVGVNHFDPKFLASLLETIVVAIKFQHDIREISPDGLG